MREVVNEAGEVRLVQVNDDITETEYSTEQNVE